MLLKTVETPGKLPRFVAVSNMAAAKSTPLRVDGPYAYIDFDDTMFESCEYDEGICTQQKQDGAIWQTS